MPGAISGMLFIGRVARWLQFVRGVMEKPTGSFSVNEGPRPWKTFAAAVFYPTPWVALGLMVWAIHHIIVAPFTNEWRWFYIGFFGGPLVTGYFIYRKMSQLRARRLSQGDIKTVLAVDSASALKTEITYKIHIDEIYYRTLIDRYYTQRPLLFRLPVQFGLLALISAGAFLSFIIAPLENKAAVSIIMAAVVFFGGIAATKWGIYQRFRYRGDFGTDATVSMSEAGLVANGRHAQGKWNWAAYPGAVRYSDGIMLLHPGVIRWLPDSGLVVGTPEEATALVNLKSKLRKLTN
jgi:hypothetical protein